MRLASWQRAIMVLVLLVSSISCTLLDGGGDTTPEATEPPANQIVFSAPQLSYLQAGDRVAGSRLEYLGQTDDGFLVRIDGQETTKKTGDSFNWHGPAVLDDAGHTVAGVELDFKLRIVGIILGQFEAFGDIDIIITDPSPAVAELPTEATLEFTKAVIDLTVATSEMVPGTTLSYLGKTDQGAEFGGVEGYAFRELWDSLDWSGRMRDNVYADLNLRVRSIQKDQVSLTGTATIWIAP